MCIWTGALRDVVCNSSLHAGVSPEPDEQPSRWRETYRTPPPDDKPRIPYSAGTDFEGATRAALRLTDADNLYGPVLSYLADCYPLSHLLHEQERGASYKRLAAIAHIWGIRRREEHIRTLENDPENFHDGYDDALYGGEAIEEHTARVDTLLSALDERDEAWRREHRPDLVDTPNEIDGHIAEVEAEIRALKVEIRSSKPKGEGVGAIG